MSKYRLCYLDCGGYKSIDLSKLECLNGQNTTDIKTIDGITTNFENMEGLLDFFKRNKLIDDDINKVVITVDKTTNGVVYHKKIFNGEILLFKEHTPYLSVSYIYKWLMENIDNQNCLIEICNNFIDKYKNAYNRITGSSYILPIFTTLKRLALNIKNNQVLSDNDLREFDNCINDFMTIEFYKIDKDVLAQSKGATLARKKDKNGKFLKSYRNIHDFVILMNSLEKRVQNVNKPYISDDILEKSLIENIGLGTSTQIEIKNDMEYVEEEFLTEEDNLKNVKNMMKFMQQGESDSFEPFRDGNDFIAPMSLDEIENALYESGKKLCIKLGDGYLE